MATQSEPLRTRILPWLHTHRLRLLVLFVGVLLPLWLFGQLASGVIEREDFGFDVPLLLLMYRNATPQLDQLMLFCSLIGFAYGVVPVDLLVGLVLLVRRRWGDALFWVLAVGGAGLLNLTSKLAFSRQRPNLWLSLAPESTFSFPSGHAMASMALAAAAAVLAWPTRWRWPVLALGSLLVPLVGLSRVYLGVHYPSDILAGWAASLAWVVGLSGIMYGWLAKPTPRAEPRLDETVASG